MFQLLYDAIARCGKQTSVLMFLLNPTRSLNIFIVAINVIYVEICMIHSNSCILIFNIFVDHVTNKQNTRVGEEAKYKGVGL